METASAAQSPAWSGVKTRGNGRNAGKGGIWNVAPHPGALRSFYCVKNGKERTFQAELHLSPIPSLGIALLTL